LNVSFFPSVRNLPGGMPDAKREMMLRKE